MRRPSPSRAAETPPSRRRVVFPAFPSGLKGRRHELAALSRLVAPPEPGRIALVGGGGCGKSMLACALGYRVKSAFSGGAHWFRSGPWDARTLSEMLAVRFGTSRERSALWPSLRAYFAARGPLFVVLDNHENDRAVATLLNEFELSPVTWLITARRCLLGGVHVFPVVPPLAAKGGSAFPRVRALAELLRYSPLALGIADGLVRSGATRAEALRSWLAAHGVDRVRVIDHEDDLPGAALLVEWAWQRLGADQRRMLAVLAHTGGDHVDGASLAALAQVRAGKVAAVALATLRQWQLVESPLPDRYSLHAVVRYAVSRRTRFSARTLLEHYLALLERAPDRLDLEQTHLYAAMDYAHGQSNLGWMLRIERLLAMLDSRAVEAFELDVSVPLRASLQRGPRGLTRPGARRRR
ncbi:MAG: hypothetical protein M3O36_08640 [Myxococcota bacterium]|nr:hypothetical protein [Myxococcota bacterium]